MKYTADYLVSRRKEKWEESYDIEFDKKFRSAVAKRLTEDRELLAEVQANPEKLVELVFVVVDKRQKTMPFFLNAVQHEFVGQLNQAIADYRAGLISSITLLVLKGRQQGFTTFITAYQLACCILNRNFQGFTLADESSNTETIFQNKAKFVYSQLPDVLKPTEKFNNRRQFLFELINSGWEVDTATKQVGRSRTINFFHGSECAFWRDGIASIQAALGEALTKDCIGIYESTANGYNDYEKMWNSGVFVNCFYEWWKTPEYRDTLKNAEVRKEFLEQIEKGSDWIHDRLRWLRDEKNLDEEQLYWYWNKYKKYLDKNLIKQEYPCFPQEAFLLSGKPVFDTVAIHGRLASLQKPLKVGYFEYDYDGLKISNIHWVNDRNGMVQLYYLPNSPQVTKYAIGGDTAGEGSDFFTAHVLDAKTGAQVAHMKHEFDSDLYARQVYCLGWYYKWALVGIEANFDVHPIKELQRLGYPNQYIRESVDSNTGKKAKKFGFRTDELTRPTIISRLIGIVRDHVDTINDLATLEELQTIVKSKTGRPEAPSGKHDDDMMGLAIAHEVRTQVYFDEHKIPLLQQDFFGTEWESSGWKDYEEKIEII